VTFVFVILLALVYTIGFVVGGDYFFLILIFGTIISIAYVVGGYYKSASLAIASVKAKEAKGPEYRQYHNIVEGLTLASGLPMPKLYVMNNEQINAFASGRDPQHAVICVTTGALKKLSKHELEGVLAHELGHISNYDIRYMTLVSVMVGIIAIVSQIFLRSLWFRSGDGGDGRAQIIFMVIGILLAILAPIVVYFIQMSISRKREFSADATAIQFTRYPKGLIGALKKIKGDTTSPKIKTSKALAPLFISSPFKGLARTHPPIEKRIAILERM